MTVRARLLGAERCIERLQTLDKKVRNSINRKAARAGGAVFLQGLRANAPKRNGTFKRSLTQKPKTYRGNGVVVSIIGQNVKYTRTARKKTRRTMEGGISGQGFAVPIRFVEHDTKPKTIVPTRAKALRLAASNLNAAASRWGAVFVRAVRHPGSRGSRLVSKTERSNRGQVESAVRQKILAELPA